MRTQLHIRLRNIRSHVGVVILRSQLIILVIGIKKSKIIINHVERTQAKTELISMTWKISIISDSSET